MYGTMIHTEDDMEDDMEDGISECVICLDPLDGNASTQQVICPFDCNHRLHKVCFNDYLSFNSGDDVERVIDVKCPLCRRNIVIKKKYNWSSMFFRFMFCVFLCSTLMTLYYRVYLVFHHYLV
uniref:RING-type domain-containing protein n=1 Tax=Pyramimonas orientalis virus TaxID=455367 RepID=A0A7M3UNS6_POV01|nr:hypothetical protein HWQ62_00220 [Pyramimonas orientalis virus]